MPRKLFIQIIALICIGGIVFVVAAQAQSWLAVRTYQAQLLKITNDEKEKTRLAEIQAAIARNSASVLDTAADQVSAPKAVLPSRHKDASDVGVPASGNDNMVDDQRVTRKGDFWVNSKGKVMSAAGD